MLYITYTVERRQMSGNNCENGAGRNETTPAEGVFDLYEADARLATFPIFREDLWKFYKTAERSFWTREEIDVSKDVIDYRINMDGGHRKCVDYILAFFAQSDGIVNLNLAKRFKQEVPMLEAGYFYDFQIMMENIHAETYSALLDAIIEDPSERACMLNAVKEIPVIGKMANYVFDCINSAESFPARLLRMACVEGIFFSGCFCIIYWLQEKGLMPGLTQSNNLISRDEGLHTMFALYLYTLVRDEHKLSAKKIREIFDHAVGIATEFATEAIPDDLPQMNSGLMSDYIKYVANNLLALIDQEPIYPVRECPFSFMEKLNMENRANFFEKRVTNYCKSAVAISREFLPQQHF